MRSDTDELQRLRQWVSYDAETGRFTVARVARCINVGDLAGTVSNGRRYVTIERRKFSCARLALWFTTGVKPEQDVDHIDGDKLNDRAANLREVSARVNGENIRRARSHNRLGVLGVRLNHGAYEARITVRGKERVVGRYKTAAEASNAYITAKRQLHEGCTI